MSRDDKDNKVAFNNWTHVLAHTDDKTRVCAAPCNDKMAFVVHPCWRLSSLCKIRTTCITEGCTYECACNALQRHMKSVHMIGEYNVHELSFIEADTNETGNEEDSRSDSDEQ